MRIETIGNATLYMGDCFDILPSIQTVDAIITDPPYAVPTAVASARDVTRNLGDLSIVEFAMRAYITAATDKLTDKGRVFIFCDGTFYPVVFRVLYGRFSTALLVWGKGQIGMGREFRKSHELILHGWKSGTPIYSDGVGRSDVLRFPAVPTDARVHPAQKPEQMLAELVRPCGKTILDPFMGSGATGVAALQAGRKFIGIEINEDYFDQACERLAAIQGESKIDMSQAQGRLLA